MKDKIGMWASFICLIHCLLFPILGTIFPLFIQLDSAVEISLVIISFVIGSLSFIDSAIKHKYFVGLILFIVGFLNIIIANTIDKEFISIFGLLMLITAHYLNYKYTKNIDGNHPHNCKH